MDHGLIFGLIGVIIAIGSVIVSVTTKMNHVHTNTKLIKDMKVLQTAREEKVDKIFSKIWDQIEETSKDVSFIKGKMNHD